jgi:hypothetical protein
MRLFFLLLTFSFAIAKEPILFIRFRSTITISNAVIGASPTIYDPTSTYGDGIFGSAFLLDSEYPTRSVYYDTKAISWPSDGCVEFWISLSNWEIVDGVPSKSANFFESARFNTDPWGEYMGLQAGSGTTVFWISYFIEGGGGGAGEEKILTLATLSIASNTWTHIAMTWDSGTKYFYADNVLIGQSLADDYRPIGITCQPNIGTLWDRSGFVANCWIDLLRIWDYPKSNFSDRFNERNGLNEDLY